MEDNNDNCKGEDKLPKVSIIVPVYNAEKYIEKCLNSIIDQTYKNLEIIIINDGSKDSSLEICCGIKQSDRRIKVINNGKNHGSGFSRNRGITEAKGEYILFVDCDDTIEKNYVEEMLKAVAFGKYELAICRLADVYIDDHEEIIKKTYRRIPQNLTGDFYSDYYKLYPETVNLCGPAVKIYNKKIIEQHNILFPEDVSWGEDQAFNQSYYKFVRTYVFLNSTCYNYCHRNNASLSQQYNKNNLWERLFSIKRIKNFLNENNIKEKEMILGDHCFLIINDLVKLDNKQDGFQEYKKRVYLLKDIVRKEWKGSNWKRRVVFFCIDKNVFLPIYIYYRLKGLFAGV